MNFLHIKHCIALHCIAYALFIKLMNRNTPVNLLAVIEKWFAISVTCVKWGDRMSIFLNLVSGVRQGGVLSQSLFAIYVDDMAKKIISRGIGCHMSFICTGIFLYADDLFLIAPVCPYTANNAKHL